MTKEKGVLLVFATALISGFSIFINKFGVQGINPYVFTGLKNLIVGVLIVSLIMLLAERKKLFELTQKQWLGLGLIGLIGGSVPFLLFFKALSMTAPANAGFIHKTLFIYVSILAFIFLKEKVGKSLIIGLAALLLGNVLLLKFSPQALGLGELLALIATFFWAAEIIISKKLLKNMSSRIVAGGRMFFGSMFIMIFLAATNQIQFIGQLSLEQVGWVLLTSVFLLGYVLTFYGGLKYVSASTATAILALGAPITISLNVIFSGKSLTFGEISGLGLIIVGLWIITKLYELRLAEDNSGARTSATTSFS